MVGLQRTGTAATRREMLAGTASGGAGVVVVACGAHAPAAPSAGAVKGPVTIEVLTRNGVSSPNGHSQWYATTTPEKFTPQTNITAQFIDGVPNVGQMHITLAAAGTPPDAVWFSAISDGSGGPLAATKGWFKPLEDLIKRDKVDRSTYWKRVMEVFSVGGKLFALPTHGSFDTNVMFVNLDLMKRAGITVPMATGDWTTDQLIDWARRATRPQDNVWGWWPQTGIAEPTMLFLRLFGGDLLSPDGKRCVLDSAQAREGLQWQLDAQQKFGIIDNLLRPEDPMKAFEEGRTAFYNWTPYHIATWTAPAGRERIKFEWGATAFPRHPRGTLASQLAANGFGVTGTPRQDAAWEWIKFITNRENGVLQVEGGAGSPGARQDVWEDPRLAKLSPAYALIQKVYKEPGPFNFPANFRYPEVLKAADDRLRDLWEGRSSVNDTAVSATREVNAVLAQPVS